MGWVGLVWELRGAFRGWRVLGWGFGGSLGGGGVVVGD